MFILELVANTVPVKLIYFDKWAVTKHKKQPNCMSLGYSRKIEHTGLPSPRMPGTKKDSTEMKADVSGFIFSCSRYRKKDAQYLFYVQSSVI